MAIVQCRECGAQISSKAKICPSCGIKNPGKQPGGCLGALIALFLFVAMFGSATNMIGGRKNTQPHPSSRLTDQKVEMIMGCEEIIRKFLNYPSTYSRHWTPPDVSPAPGGRTAVTIWFDAKNGLGADLPQQGKCIFEQGKLVGLPEITAY